MAGRYVYWRLLSTDPEAAKDVVLAEKPVIADSASSLDPALLDQLLSEISSLASVRAAPPTPLPCLPPHAAVPRVMRGGGVGDRCWSTRRGEYLRGDRPGFGW